MTPRVIMAAHTTGDNEMTTTTADETYEQRRARKDQERAERQKECKGIAVAVAAELGASVEAENRERGTYDRSHVLVLEGRRFIVDFGHASEKVMRCTVSGSWPRERTLTGSTSYHSPHSLSVIPRDEKAPEITVNATRGHAAIAKEITRRFLPDFVRIYDAMAERIKQHENAGADAHAAALALGKEYGADVGRDGQSCGLYIKRANHSHVLRVSSYNGSISIRFEYALDGITLAQARKILDVLGQP